MRRALRSLLGRVSLAACGGGAPGLPQDASLTLDWTPNPDHVGFYYAPRHGPVPQGRPRRGDPRAIRSRRRRSSSSRQGEATLPSRTSRRCSSPAQKKLPVVAVASVIGQPLNSFMSIDPSIRSLADLKGHSVGITGVPADHAALESAGLADDVRVVNVGYSLLPALLSHKVDAVLGVYRNVEGIELEQRGFTPTVIPLDRAGVPTLRRARPRCELRAPSLQRRVRETPWRIRERVPAGHRRSARASRPLAPGPGARSPRRSARSWPPRYPRPSRCSGTAA